MKKVIVLALLVVASAAATQVWAGKKKKSAEKISLATANDSLSYAAGSTATMGLMNYLAEMQMDTAYMADFIEGFKTAVAESGNPRVVARIVGAQVARLAENAILPNMKKAVEGSDYSINTDLFYKGFVNSLMKDTTVMTVGQASNMLQQKMKQIKADRDSLYKHENEAWLLQNAKKDSVVVLPSGVQYKVLRQGTGVRPSKTDEVVVKYEGRTIDGNIFDSSYKRNPQTITFRCDQVIPGWSEAVTMMPVGSEWEIYIPQNLAYGERQAGSIKPYSTLVFKVELVDVKKVEEKKADAAVAEAKKDVKPVKKASRKGKK